jgi:hypothetical protein
MSLIIPNELIYSSPKKNITSSGNYQSFAPVSGTSFTANENIRIVVSSSTHFLDYQKSYISYDMILTDSAASTGSVLAGVAPLYRVSEQLGGLQVSDIPSYNTMCGIFNACASSTKQNALKSLEGYGDLNAYSSTGSLGTYGRKCLHSLKTPLAGIQQLLPLPYASYQLDVQLDTVNNTVAKSTATNYTIRNVRFNAFLVKPDGEYLSQVQNAFSQGQTMKIPFEQIRSFNLRPNTSLQQNLIMNVGVVDSIRSFLMTSRLTGSVNTNTTDAFALYTNGGLDNYFFNINGTRFPQNYAVSCKNSNDSTASISAEQLIMAMSSVDNDFSQLNSYNYVSGANAGTNINEFVYYYFATNRSFGSGIETRDGVIDIQLNYSSAPVATTVINCFVSHDSILEISQNTVSVRNTNL